MCATPYFLHDTFAPFESQIRARFARAVDDTNLNSDDTAELVIVDKSARLDQYEAEFGALVNPDRVQITWNGIASLWACGQGLGRLARRMFEAQRAGAARLYLDKDPELAKGFSTSYRAGWQKTGLTVGLTGFRSLMRPQAKKTISLATDCFSLHLVGLSGMNWRTSNCNTTLE
jgi:hypothetical protein